MAGVRELDSRDQAGRKPATRAIRVGAWVAAVAFACAGVARVGGCSGTPTAEDVTPPTTPLGELLVAARTPDTGAVSPERYNLLVFLSDALRASNLSLYGYRRDTTPNLSSFADHAIRFAQHHANYPATALSVSQFHSGRVRPPLLMGNSPLRYPTRAIESDLFVLPRELQRIGYRTSIATAHPWFDDDARLLQWFEDRHLVEAVEGEAYADAADVVAEARTFLESGDTENRPFFLYLHVMDTHLPNQLHPGFATDEVPRWIPAGYAEYDSEIAYMDHWFGEAVRALAETGQLSNTIVVFTADHGEEFGEQGAGAWNQEHGWTLRRPLLHVPLIIWHPRDPEPGRVIDGLTRHVDIAPTLARMADPSVDLGPFHIDGHDLSGTLTSPGEARVDPPDSLSFSARYWGLHTLDQEVHHDTWHDADVALDLSIDRWNYEQGVPLAAGSAAPALIERLDGQRVAQQRAWDELRPRPDAVDHAVLAFAGTANDSGAAPLTYSESGVDHRWAQQGGYRLICHPTERCGAASMSFPWTPGRYHVSLRFDPSRLEEFRNEVTVSLPDTGQVPVRVGGGAESAYVGEFDLVDPLTVHISEPAGGVALTGIELTRVGADVGLPGEAGSPAMDPHQLEQLRALGYID
jgi:arylsulfatase A-like enzyme